MADSRWLVAVALTLLLAGCAMRPLEPTATAIPLAATATPAPRSTRAPVTPIGAAATAPAVAVASTATAPAVLAEAEGLLARRTVEAFLAQLVLGRAESAFELYLSDAARQADAGQLLSSFQAPNSRLLSAGLQKIEPVAGTGYEAEALLQWAAGGGNRASARLMRLTLVMSRGLWLIDRIALVEPETPTPSP